MRSGQNPHRVSLVVGSKSGMWSDDVIGPILADIDKKKHEKAETKQKKDDAFEKLRDEAVEILDGCASIEHLPSPKLTTLIRFVFSATETVGVTNATRDRDAMLYNLLDVLTPARILALIDDPPKLSGRKLPSDWPPLHVPKESGKGAGSSSSSGGLTAPDAAARPNLHQSFADQFGTDWQMGEEHEELQPVEPPPWLEGALDFASETGNLLIGQRIIYRFPKEDGGWSVGTINGQLDDENDTLEVVDGALTGNLPLNFEVEYEDGLINHLLMLDDYATSSRADDGSWCMVVSSGRSKGKSKAKAKDQALPDVAALSDEQVAALLQQLQAREQSKPKGRGKATARSN